VAEGLVKTYRKKCCAFRCLVLRLELNAIFCVSFTCNCKCDVYEKKKQTSETSSCNVQDVFASVLVSNAALAKSAVTSATLSREVSKI